MSVSVHGHRTVFGKRFRMNPEPIKLPDHRIDLIENGIPGFTAVKPLCHTGFQDDFERGPMLLQVGRRKDGFVFIAGFSQPIFFRVANETVPMLDIDLIFIEEAIG